MNTKRKPHVPHNSYPDLVSKEQIQTYLLKRTGVLVTKQRIGRWISSGEIRLIKFPRREGGGHYTRRLYLDALVRKYSASPAMP